MSKQTLYGSTQRRVVMPSKGMLFRGKLLTDEARDVLVAIKEKAADTLVSMAEQSDKYHYLLWDSEYWLVRVRIAEQTDKYHEVYVTDENDAVRLAVVLTSDKYHELLKADPYWKIRNVIARTSDKYHELFREDPDWEVRLAVALYSDTYHAKFKDDRAWQVRLAVAKASTTYHDQLKNDINHHVRACVKNKEHSAPYIPTVSPNTEENVARYLTRLRNVVWFNRALRQVETLPNGADVYITVTVTHNTHIDGLAEGSWASSASLPERLVRKVIVDFLTNNEKSFHMEDIVVNYGVGHRAQGGTWYCVLDL